MLRHCTMLTELTLPSAKLEQRFALNVPLLALNEVFSEARLHKFEHHTETLKCYQCGALKPVESQRKKFKT